MKELLASRSWGPEQLYLLLGAQVKSWHKHYRMGENSSVTTEMAGELLEGIAYTLDCAGSLPGERIQQALERGQEKLRLKWEKAQTLHNLVYATAPEDMSQSWFETVAELGKFLRQYDVLHFPHRMPLEVFYPLLNPLQPELQGIDYVLAYLSGLWIENQLLHSFSQNGPEGLEQRADLWDAPVNLCEQPLCNAIGRLLLGMDLSRLTLDGEDLACLTELLGQLPREKLEKKLEDCARELCGALSLPEQGALAYVCAAAAQLAPRLEAAAGHGRLDGIFRIC